MSYFLVASIIISLIAIIYVWYITRGLNSIPDDESVPLHTDEDKLLIHWYKLNTVHSFDFIDDIDVAIKYLKRIHDIETNRDSIVIGTNLEYQYFTITHRELRNKYSPNVDCIFDIRSTLAKTGEIAIIHNPKIAATMRRNNTFDFNELNSIMESNLDIIARDYMQEILKARWEQILELNDSQILLHNTEGSYLYLRIPSSEDTVNILGGVTAKMTPLGARINLLCSNYEFESLISRWKQHLQVTI